VRFLQRRLRGGLWRGVDVGDGLALERLAGKLDGLEAELVGSCVTEPRNRPRARVLLRLAGVVADDDEAFAGGRDVGAVVGRCERADDRALVGKMPGYRCCSPKRLAR
jgi:hypothetical protein